MWLLASPRRILLLMLGVIFLIETTIMLVLPSVMPGTLSESGKAILDSVLLTVVSAPVLWCLLVGPLRRIAVREQMRAETIITHAGDSIVTIGRRGHIVSFNRVAEAVFGLPAPEAIGRTLNGLIPAIDFAAEKWPSPVELEAVRFGSERFPIAVSLAPLPAECGGGFVAVIRDLTEVRQAEQVRLAAVREQEALRAHQMATLAQLATGVAHEIRNPLTSISLLIQVNRAEFESRGLPVRDLELVEQEIRRMERSVNALLDYGRPSLPDRRTIRLPEILARAIRLLDGPRQASQITIEQIASDDSIAIDVDAAEIQQLIVNLGLNAIEAMPGGGQLIFHIDRDGDNVVLTVTDTGLGLSPIIRETLFTPFVTSKPEGIGLGLAICRRIAESHGGVLTGENGPRGGAQFTLRLPSSRISTSGSV